MHSAVASSCLQMVRHGLGLSNVTGSARHRALRALTTIIRCLPPTGSLDYKYNDPEYRRIRTQVVDALDVFRRFLFTSLARSCTWEVNNVLVTLREHGTKAGVISQELSKAMATYMDECRELHEWRESEEWVQKLQRYFQNSGQVCMSWSHVLGVRY